MQFMRQKTLHTFKKKIDDVYCIRIKRLYSLYLIISVIYQEIKRLVRNEQTFQSDQENLNKRKKF